MKLIQLLFGAVVSFQTCEKVSAQSRQPNHDFAISLIKAIDDGDIATVEDKTTEIQWFKIKFDPEGPTTIDADFLVDQLSDCESISLRSYAVHGPAESNTKASFSCSNRVPLEDGAKSGASLSIARFIDGQVNVTFEEERLMNLSPPDVRIQSGRGPDNG